MEFQESFTDADIQLLNQEFEDNGFIGPVQIFQSDVAAKIALILSHSGPAVWPKGYAADSRDYYDIATHPSILERVTAILGEDVMLWGANLVTRKPGKVHPWHSDMETVGGVGRTVSVWLGLQNVNYNSSLQVIKSSHKFGISIQEMRHKTGVDRSNVNPEQVLKWAREIDPGSTQITCSMKDGDAIFFDGNLWHGTDNINLTGTRKALLIQYATPNRPVKAPSYSNFDWPFQFRDDIRPPCIMVRGTDKFGVNEIVEPPSTSSNIKSWIVQLDLPLPDDPEKGWKPHRIHSGNSPVMDRLTCHASVLSPGKTPHPPHKHAEEEILIVLDGIATVLIGDGNDQQSKELQRGEFIYYPGGQLHTIRNNSDDNITYLMFKWRNNHQRHTGELLKTSLVSHITEIESDQINYKQSWTVKRLLQGKTEQLSKLHSHMSILKPGGGYEPHADNYDVAILVLSGNVETLGREVGPNGLIFYFKGEPHGIRNIGESNAVYLVFEFHNNFQPIRYKRLIKKRLWKLQEYAARILPSSARPKARQIITALTGNRL